MTNSTIQSLKQELSIDDLSYLLNILSCVKHKCVYIGLHLGVSDNTIQSITKQHTSHLDQLCDILRHRLNQVPHLTLHNIIQALKSRSVEENLLANEIQSQCAHQALASGSPPEPLLLPFSTNARSTLSPPPGPSTSMLASAASSSRPEMEPVATYSFNSQQAAYVPTQPSYQISRQPLDTLTSRTHQHCTLKNNPPVPQHMGIPSPGARLNLKTPISARTTSDPLQPHFSSGNDTVQHVGQATGMTTPHNLHLQRMGQGQLQLQHISNHASQTHSTESSGTGYDCITPQAKRVHYCTALDQFIDYIKATYRLSIIEKSLNVIKWPPTPSKIFINLACIDWKTVVTRKEADEFTRAMVEDGNVDVIMKKKTPIQFKDIAQNVPDAVSVILVKGAPGVGKSTFAWELCRRWEKGEIAQQYKLVLLLRLRDERMSKAQSLRDLLYHPKGIVCDAVEEDLITSFGDKCLIILEGFDELPDICRRESSIFLQLINGYLLPKATILVTSRPWATNTLLTRSYNRIHKHIEILGFTECHIEEYVRSVFSDEENTGEREKDIEDTMTYIETHRQIKACVYIPLNSAIVVSVYKESKAGRCILPKTLTELYYALTQTLLLRYLHGHPVHSRQVWSIHSFEHDLPGEVYKQLLKISEIAYNGICTDWGESVQVIYSDLPPAFETLGLMQSVNQMFVTQGVNVSHNFLHLTVQEFLAALHISNMPPDEQLEHLKRHKEGRFRVVLRFLAGLTKLQNIPPCERRALLKKPLHTSAPYTQMKPDISLSVHHVNWMFESQSSDVINTWLQYKTVQFLFPKQMSPLEYYSVGYCIAHSSARWILIIREHKKETDLEMFCDGITSTKEADFKVGLRVFVCMASDKLNILFTNLGPHVQELHLRLRDGSITLENFSALQVLHLELHCTTFDLTTSFPSKSLKSLIFAAGSDTNALGPNSCAAIGKLLSSSVVLECLYFLQKQQLQIGSGGLELITKAVATTPSLPLKNLNITGMKQEDIEPILEALAINDSLPLKRLTLSTTEFSGTASGTLGLLIQTSKTLECVSWEEEQKALITVCGLREMMNAVDCYSWLPLKLVATGLGRTHICKVYLTEDGTNWSHIWYNPGFCDSTFTFHNIDAEETVLFAASLIKNSPVTELSFSICDVATVLAKVLHPDEQVSGAGITALAQALYCNSTMQKLGLSHNSIGDAGAISLAQILHSNFNLQVLDLSYNGISDVGAIAFAQALHRRSTLQELVLSNSSITDAGASALAQALHKNKRSTLRMLNLHNNGISDTGATALALALHHNSTLQVLYLSKNSISDAGATTLALALHHNSTLQVLDLSNNSISDDGATTLALALHHNSTLQVLDLSFNSISDAGAAALAQALHHNSTLQKLSLCNHTFRIAEATALAQHILRPMKLDLPNSSIGDTGATAIAQALHYNSTLVFLSLSSCSISDAGATALAESLHHNSTLRKLDLCHNSISDDGATALAQALHHNSTLWVLNLSHNSIGDAGAAALALALHHNSTLCGLDVSGNDAIHTEGTCQLLQALTVNKSVCWRRRDVMQFVIQCSGLVLPKKCEESATQCPEYNAVNSRIIFA